MAGIRNRCLYCSDSRAADVDHFVPIAKDYTRAFVWTNHLWACAECNRRKSQRFPTAADGSPLILNPTMDDPWRFLVLDTQSGVLAARYDNDQLDARGAATLEIIAALNYEPVIEGRRRVIRRVTEAAGAIVNYGDESARRGALAQEIRSDEFGVSPWFAWWEGGLEEPFATLRLAHESLWRRFVTWTLDQRA